MEKLFEALPENFQKDFQAELLKTIAVISQINSWNSFFKTYGKVKFGHESFTEFLGKSTEEILIEYLRGFLVDTPRRLLKRIPGEVLDFNPKAILKGTTKGSP